MANPHDSTLRDLPTPHQILEISRQRTNGFARALDGYYNFAFGYPTQENSFEGTGVPSWNNINTTEQSLLNHVKAFTDFLDDMDLAAAREDRETEKDRKKFLVQSQSGERRKVLEETYMYPNDKFPYLKGYGEETMMYELLRKRPDPMVSAWMQKCEGVGKEMEEGIEMNGKKISETDYVRLWNWAAAEGIELMQKIYTGATEEDEYEEGDEDDEDEDVPMMDQDGKATRPAVGKAAFPLEYLLSYGNSGYIPPNR